MSGGLAGHGTGEELSAVAGSGVGAAGFIPGSCSDAVLCSRVHQCRPPLQPRGEAARGSQRCREVSPGHGHCWGLGACQKTPGNSCRAPGVTEPPFGNSSS